MFYGRSAGAGVDPVLELVFYWTLGAYIRIVSGTCGRFWVGLGQVLLGCGNSFGLLFPA